MTEFVDRRAEQLEGEGARRVSFFPYDPGTLLGNGAFVIDFRIRGDEIFVLALWVRRTPEYVTWAFDESTGECFWGHYFDSLQAGVEDLKGRVS